MADLTLGEAVDVVVSEVVSYLEDGDGGGIFELLGDDPPAQRRFIKALRRLGFLDLADQLQIDARQE